MVETIRFTRGNLPHWLVADRPYFVTIRLAGSLPKDMVEELKQEREELMAIGLESEDVWTDMQRRQFARIEKTLDACRDERMWLTTPAVADIVFENLDWLEKKRGWNIYAATVMGNHVHILMKSTNGRSGELLEDFGKFKSFTARIANGRLGRKGAFWAREDFDHWCRNEDKMRGAARYICNNTVKAGLVKEWRDWPWTRCAEDFRPL